MSDSTPIPEETPAPEAEPTLAKAKKKNNAALAGGLIVILIIVIIVLALWWLRGCSPSGTSGTGQTAGQPSTSTVDVSTATLDDRIHAALHAQSLTNGERLDTVIYIFEVSTDGRVAVTITLTGASADLARNRVTNPQNIAAASENAVLAAVPEVTSVTVVDGKHVVIGAQTRK